MRQDGVFSNEERDSYVVEPCETCGGTRVQQEWIPIQRIGADDGWVLGLRTCPDCVVRMQGEAERRRSQDS